MARTDEIKRAIFVLLEARRAELDAAADLRSLVLDLKFEANSSDPIVVIDHITRERRRVPREHAKKTA